MATIPRLIEWLQGLIFHSQLTLGFPGLESRQYPTCKPKQITTVYVSTITSVATLPYPCYTKTIVTSRTGKGNSRFNYSCTISIADAGEGCPDLATCPPAILCIVESTTTVKVPAIDKCCPKTATITTPGACASCQTGCATTTYTSVCISLFLGRLLAKVSNCSTQPRREVIPCNEPHRKTQFRVVLLGTCREHIWCQLEVSLRFVDVGEKFVLGIKQDDYRRIGAQSSELKVRV